MGMGSNRPCTLKYGSASKRSDCASASLGVWQLEPVQTEVIAPVGAHEIAAGSMERSLSMRNTSESPAETETSTSNGIAPVAAAGSSARCTSAVEPHVRSEG